MKGPTLRLGALVAVVWADPLQGVPYWKGAGGTQGLRPVVCRSVGYVAELDAERVVIAQTVTADHWGGLFAIPLGSIQSAKALGPRLGKNERP